MRSFWRWRRWPQGCRCWPHVRISGPGHRFARDGPLYTPTGYPIYPADLWLFEFAQRNDMLTAARAWSSALHGGQPVPLAANDEPPEIA
ncbi:MAG: hypothetical protein WBL23_12000 [Salinisphaera sp.]|uniref:hypothetical protein n=1 Tax=Salinisphaera sp. TaxID=1914330 RepID=UPI003C7DFCC9